jgi:hypothetical protein
MKITAIIIIGVCLCMAPLSGQDIESQLSGSTSAQGFTIKDGNGTSLFRLGGNGRIGMGATSPQGLLHMQGDIGGADGIRFHGATDPNWYGLNIIQTGLGDAARVWLNNQNSSADALNVSNGGSGSAIRVISSNINSTLLQMFGGNIERFLVKSDGTVSMNGSLGLGTASPVGKLDITGSGMANALRILPWSGNGSAIWVNQSGTGNAARFQVTLASSTSYAVEASTNAPAPAILASSTNAAGRIIEAINGASGVRFFVESGGNVGIGVDDATQDLDVLNNARFRGVSSLSYAAPLNLTSAGILTTATSDARLKTDIHPLGASLEKVLRLRGVRYHWKSEPDGGARIGFIAQEVRDVVPEVVYTNPTDGYLGLNYAELTAILVEAVKEQQIMIDALTASSEEIATLRDRVRQMEAREDRVRQLEADLVSLKRQLEEYTAGHDASQASLRSEQ